MFMQHLLVDLKQVATRHHIILIELWSGFMHSIQATKFQRLNDGHKMYVKCLHNFFSRSDATKNVKSKRKLNLDFVSWNLNVSPFNIFQSMFQILLQMKTYICKQNVSWLLLESNFMFSQFNQQVSKKSNSFSNYIFFFMDGNVISRCF